MMTPKFSVGDRVQIVARDSPCFGSFGVISNPPLGVRRNAEGWIGHVRDEQDRPRLEGDLPCLIYWVQFEGSDSHKGDILAGEFAEVSLQRA
jgi:hypothetical protein